MIHTPQEWVVARLKDSMTHTWPVEQNRAIEFMRDYWAVTGKNASLAWIDHTVRRAATDEEVLIW